MQLVYLIVMLLLRNKLQFYKIIGLDKRDVVKLRDKIIRKNIQYQVHEYEKEREEEEVQKLVEEKKKQYLMLGQIIIYYKEINQVKRLVEVLGCSVYYYKVGTTEQKRQILRQLIKGQEQVFIVINVLGLGINTLMI